MTLPPTAESALCSNPEEATWTGLGGVNSKNLVQDGTAINSSGGYSAWYEYLNGSTDNPSKLLGNIAVHPGDNMHAYVSYETANGVIDFYVADNSTGQSQSVEISGVGTSYYDGSTADYITERPLLDGTVVPLQHFSSYSTSSDEAETTSGTWLSISSAPYPKERIMYAEYSGDLLAQPSGLNASGEGFSVTWYNCS